MKILFTDLDGTLLNDSAQVSDYTIEIIKRFVDAGNYLVPSSGRSLSSIIEVVHDAGLTSFVRYILAYNGAQIWDTQTNSPVMEWRVSHSDAITIFNEARTLGIHTQTYINEQILTQQEDKEISFYTRKIHMPVIYASDPMKYTNEDLLKILAIKLDDHDYLCDFRNKMQPIIGDRIKIEFSNPYYLEFFNIAAGKGNAAKKLCEILEINIADSYSAGDEQNDISMIKATGCGIAMANATSLVKESADVITDYTNKEDGLARFIEKNIL